MRLVFVHGINQQGQDPDELRRVWINDIERGMGRPGALSGVTVDMPYYGDILADLAGNKTTSAITQGPDAQLDRDLAEFVADGLAEQAAEMGITPQQIAEEQERDSAETADAVDMGFPMSRRINAIARVIERLSPFRGDLTLRLLDQAHAYLKRPSVASAVDAKVAPNLSPDPVVLVTHSLGTVVSFKLLRQFANDGSPVRVPLFVTLGSPLSLTTVQRALQPPFMTPTGVSRWLNARDPDDFITLNRGLHPPRFPDPIENLKDVRIVAMGGKDAHAIPGYLSHPPIALAIGDVLGL